MKKQDLNRNSGFKIPKGYFENFENTFLDRLDQETMRALLKEETQGKKDRYAGFKVPNGYFDTIESTIFDTLTTKEKAPKLIALRTWSTIGAAASIAALFAVLFFMKQQPIGIMSNTPDPVAFSSLENYVINNDMDYSIAELEFFFQTDTEDHVFSDTYSSTLDTDIIYEYLEEHIENELFLTD